MDRAAWAARAMVAQQILSMKLTGFRSAPYTMQRRTENDSDLQATPRDAAAVEREVLID